MRQLNTQRNIFASMFPGVLANDLNTIVNCADGQVSKATDLYFISTVYKFNARLNGELARRGIDYRIPGCFCKKSAIFLFLLFVPIGVNQFQIITAMNLLSEDYNKRGG